ncbi:MAG: outer membrane beta-barrel protein [Flavobacteriales bacterium]
MKKIVFVVMALVMAAGAHAQYALKVGSRQLNAGFGSSNRGLPVYAGIDWGVQTDISVGGELSFRNYNENIITTNYKHTVIGLMANANYHFNGITDIPEEYDFYGGLGVGFFFVSAASDYAGNIGSSIGIGAQIGARYYFNPKLALNIEFNSNTVLSGGKIGVTFKI